MSGSSDESTQQIPNRLRPSAAAAATDATRKSIVSKHREEDGDADALGPDVITADEDSYYMGQVGARVGVIRAAVVDR